MARTRRRLLKQLAILNASMKIAFFPESHDLRSQSDSLRTHQALKGLTYQMSKPADHLRHRETVVDAVDNAGDDIVDDAIRICMLASGSKGNSIYISHRNTAILIDAGLSGVEIERRMASRQISAGAIDAIIVSHEHADHIQGVGVLGRKHGIPVHISSPTRQNAQERLGHLPSVAVFSCGGAFCIKDLVIRPFSISHDAADPAGFIIGCNGRQIGIATDLGIHTALVRQHLKNCCGLILEANHDPQLLEHGPYPWPLKQRVKSRTGHLSNASARDLLMEVLHDGLTHVILAHLSETNNTPEHALTTVSGQLNRHRPELTVALQHTAGKMIIL
jgi:phosphoribosyl 1,2-cyclic phosphodiesterase